MKTVAIVQRRMTHYRVPLFELLRTDLSKRGIGLQLLHGEPTVAEMSKGDRGALDWAERLPTRYFAGGRILWQPFMDRVHDADLVVVPQENKHLHNLPALFNPWRHQRLAFWGHGRNLQSGSPGSLFERFKRSSICRVDWWFAYTEISAACVRAAGYPAGRITVLNNSIDTSALRHSLAAIPQAPRGRHKARLGLGEGPVGTFIGSLYPDKRIDFLLDAAEHLRTLLPGFQLAIAGAGPQVDLVRDAASRHRHVVYLGPMHGAQKAELLAASDLILNPGLVGLGILDSLVAGVPMVTTDCGIHSPEIAYLESGRNGVMTRDDMEDYVKACQLILRDERTLAALQQGAAASALNYSIESMSMNFCRGIEMALAAD